MHFTCILWHIFQVWYLHFTSNQHLGIYLITYVRTVPDFVQYAYVRIFQNRTVQDKALFHMKLCLYVHDCTLLCFSINFSFETLLGNFTFSLMTNHTIRIYSNRFNFNLEFHLYHTRSRIPQALFITKKLKSSFVNRLN